MKKSPRIYPAKAEGRLFTSSVSLRRFTTGLCLCLLCLVTAQAQHRNSRYNEYIKKYAPLAVEQMQKYKVPASITLSQGLLESGAGMSRLARQSNNHFGIKCHNGWRGPSVRHDDDAP